MSIIIPPINKLGINMSGCYDGAKKSKSIFEELKTKQRRGVASPV